MTTDWRAALEGISPELAYNTNYLRQRLGELMIEFDIERTRAERAEEAVDVLLRLHRRVAGR